MKKFRQVQTNDGQIDPIAANTRRDARRKSKKRDENQTSMYVESLGQILDYHRIL